MIFFQNIQHELLDLEIELIFSTLWVRHLNIGPKSKKNVRKHKIDTKAGKTWVWNELRPKLIHQHLALFFEKVVLSSAVTSWSLIQGPFVPKNSPNRAKSYYSFHWKLKEDRALILIYLDNMVAIFDFGHLQGVNWCQSWTKNSKIRKIKNTM